MLSLQGSFKILKIHNIRETLLMTVKMIHLLNLCWKAVFQKAVFFQFLFYLVRGGAWSRGGVETPRDCYCCGRYASYWNAFLLFFSFFFVEKLKLCINIRNMHSGLLVQNIFLSNQLPLHLASKNLLLSAIHELFFHLRPPPSLTRKHGSFPLGTFFPSI